MAGHPNELNVVHQLLRLRVKSVLLATALLAAMVAAQGKPLSFERLNGIQIRAALQGKVVGDNRHWAHHYLPNGRVIRLESGLKKSGGWSVKHDQLCLLKPEISSTEPICYDVHGRAGELQYLSEKQVVYEGVIKR